MSASNWQERAEKAEAEVDRLRAELNTVRVHHYGATVIRAEKAEAALARIEALCAALRGDGE